ncbi:hypothetical protein D3C72_2250200 [compost metagenome]
MKLEPNAGKSGAVLGNRGRQQSIDHQRRGGNAHLAPLQGDQFLDAARGGLHGRDHIHRESVELPCGLGWLDTTRSPVKQIEAKLRLEFSNHLAGR